MFSRSKIKSGELPRFSICQSSRVFCRWSFAIFAALFFSPGSSLSSRRASYESDQRLEGEVRLSRTRPFLNGYPYHTTRGPERQGRPALAGKRGPGSGSVRLPGTGRRRAKKPHFFSGTVKINRVLSGSLSAFRVPLCSAAMAAAMLSPRPKPDCSPREASAR